jgi:DNA repair exonuclease SbcCD ATPase subunit
MGELVLVKEEEFGILDNEIERREKVLVTVTEWETRIEGARARLADNSGSEGGEEDREISELRDEERAVETEIREMEDRLLQMKARQRWLKERINEGVNRREARLSGYRGALREVEGEVRQFLKAPPIPVSIVMGEEEGFVALPPSRRTLEMAKEWWSKEIGALHGRKKEVGREKEALEEGAKMWRESIDIVVEFEDELRRQMKSTEVQDVDGLRKQIGKMETAISKLEETVKIAEERGWNLLICVVGAELEAFKEGVAILRGALVGLGGASVEASFRTAETGSEDKTREVSSVDGLHGLDGLGEMGRVEGVGGQLNREESLEREESEDDGPNLAELLVDHGGE